MANKKKKYQNGFQILLIPDDQSEPKAITIPANRTKLAKTSPSLWRCMWLLDFLLTGGLLSCIIAIAI
jgi:hypothetical protein